MGCQPLPPRRRHRPDGEIGQQVAVILLQGASDQPEAASPPPPPCRRRRRRPSYPAAGGRPDRTSKLLELVAEAAQQLLDARDDDDRDQLAGTRAELISALTPPSDLLDLHLRLPGLVRPTHHVPTVEVELTRRVDGGTATTRRSPRA